jgi:hypothetical protein
MEVVDLIMVFLWVCETRNNKMFRRFGGALEHLITTCFGNAQEEGHVIDKHSLQHEFKQNATAVKVKVTLVQALRLCTGRTAHRGRRGIALLFYDQRH